MITAAKDAGIKRFVYASSSSVYGDSKELPKVEERTGNVLSPYAAMKATNELYGSVFHKVYGMETLGLRYFNVFGRRQDPNGAYAAVMGLTENPEAFGEAFNVAVGGRNTLNELFDLIKDQLNRSAKEHQLSTISQQPIYRDFRPGDIRLSEQQATLHPVI